MHNLEVFEFCSDYFSLKDNLGYTGLVFRGPKSFFNHQICCHRPWRLCLACRVFYFSQPARQEDGTERDVRSMAGPEVVQPHGCWRWGTACSSSHGRTPIEGGGRKKLPLGDRNETRDGFPAVTGLCDAWATQIVPCETGFWGPTMVWWN